MKRILKNFVLAFGLIGVNFLNANILKIGTNANLPPFEFVDENSKITGFDIDLIDAISKKVGFEYEIVNMGFDGLIPALKIGKIDAIIIGMSVTEERKKTADFTKSYYHAKNVFIKRKDNNKINSNNDFNGTIIGVQLGTIQELAIKKIPNVKLSTIKEPIDIILSLKNKKIDIAVFDSLVAYDYISKNPDLVEFYSENDSSEGFAIAFKKNRHADLISKINTALDELKADGTYNKLLGKYNLK